MRNSIVVVGSINVDLMVRCPELPRPGETVSGAHFRIEPGGKGANQALAAARMGAAVALQGCVGDDDFGRTALIQLAAAGVDLAGVVSVPGCATGVAMVQVDARGQNSIIAVPGANAWLSAEHIDAGRAVIERAALMICQLETPLPVVPHAITRAREAGVSVWLNAAPAQPLPAALLEKIDLLVVNEGEAETITGRPVIGADMAGDVATALHNAGCGIVVITLGAVGVVWCDAQGVQYRRAQPVQAVDTTGAGDTFIGALAAAWESTKPLSEAIDLAQRAAAYSVGHQGAQAAMPWAEDLR